MRAKPVLFAGSEDFKDYANYRGEYTYDANGNMTMDKNKGILSIEYNFVNLPKKIAISSPVAEGTIEYIYAADGRKLQSKQTWYPLQSNMPISNSNRAKPQAPQIMTKSYCSNMIFECKVQNAECKMQILTENGYIKDGMYHYFVKDYLGNNRLVLNEYGMIVQKNNYYPFGMSQLVDAEQQDAVPYKFSGKELESDGGLNLYDFSARFYDASTGRFGQIDPMSEKYYPISPYAYCGNNPMRYVDFKGDSISVPQQYQEQFNQDLENVFGDNAKDFSFNEKEMLMFNGKKKDLTKEQRKAFKGLDKAMKSKTTTTVIYENNAELTVGGEKKSVDIVKEFGGGVYSKDDNLIVIAPNVGDITVNLTKEDVIKTGNLRSVVSLNTTSTLFHEIGELNTPSYNTTRGRVIDFENVVRRVLRMPIRPYDLSHYHLDYGSK
ncbi:hypothetical protein FACS1894178_6240 [Bacteroidia bacterium]|nr:hypothetical protein FACS1894178_6240 [Bacteroidia bacterium]